MKKILMVDEGKCNGCKMCELICSFEHFQEFNPIRSRVRTVKINGIDKIIVCKQCSNPACANACVVGAITINKELGSPVINLSECIGCRLCQEACPIGAISLDPRTGHLLVCDLCAGEPKCARICPTRAIQFESVDKAALNLAVSRIIPSLKIKGEPHLLHDLYPKEIKETILKKEKGEL
jgi:Fe-S-cluster-containing hydrogenase component 2